MMIKHVHHPNIHIIMQGFIIFRNRVRWHRRVFFPVEDGDVVLDICAAPGGKSTELAAKLHGTGFLISNDISNSRAKALLKRIWNYSESVICVW